MKKARKPNSGFSLVEILVVIGIIALLATLASVFLFGATGKARDAKRKNDLGQIGRFLTFGCPVPAGGAGEYDLNDLIVEVKARYPQYANSVPDDIRDPKTGTDSASQYVYLVDAAGNCVLYGNLEKADEPVTMAGISAPTPRGGKGVFQGAAVGVNGSDRYFQVSN
jgi:prepilin-type N-terminal cleavage/methylation domain-containing protein